MLQYHHFTFVWEGCIDRRVATVADLVKLVEGLAFLPELFRDGLKRREIAVDVGKQQNFHGQRNRSAPKCSAPSLLGKAKGLCSGGS